MKICNIILSFLLIILHCSSGVYTDNEECTILKHTNGCSIPFGLKYPYKQFFKPVCDLHDVCYGCGALHDWDRERCDTAFTARLTKMCETTPLNKTGVPWSADPSTLQDRYNIFTDFMKAFNRWRKKHADLIGEFIGGAKVGILMWDWVKIKDPIERCKRGVLIYTISVRAFSKPFYIKNPKEFCNEKCVIPLLEHD